VTAEPPAGAKGKALRLRGKSGRIRGGVYAWAFKDGTVQKTTKVLFVAPEGGRLRFRYQTPNAARMKVTVEETGSERAYEKEMRPVQGSWTSVEIPLSELVAGSANGIKKGMRCLEIYVKMYGGRKVKGFIDDLEIVGIQASRPA
jgi:hypothetical protein